MQTRHSKLAPPPQLKAHALVTLVVLCACNLAPGHYVCIVPHMRVVIGWGAAYHCPKVDTQKHPENSKIRKYRQRAESLQIQTLAHASSGS